MKKLEFQYREAYIRLKLRKHFLHIIHIQESCFQLAHDHGISRTYSLLFIGAFWILVLFSSWFLLPSFKATSEDTEIIELNIESENEKSPRNESKYLQTIDKF